MLSFACLSLPDQCTQWTKRCCLDTACINDLTGKARVPAAEGRILRCFISNWLTGQKALLHCSAPAATIHQHVMVSRNTYIVLLLLLQVAKTAKEVRLQEEREKAAEAAKAAAKAVAEKAAADKAAASAAAGGSSAAGKAAAAAASDVWTEEDEKALWAEWKRLNDEKKAAGVLYHIWGACDSSPNNSCLKLLSFALLFTVMITLQTLSV